MPAPTIANEGFNALIRKDARIGQVKVFDQAIETPIAISESGHIAIYQEGERRVVSLGVMGFNPKYEDIPEKITVIHINNVIDYDLLIDSSSGVGGAIVGGLAGAIFGVGGAGAVVGFASSAGKTKSVDLLLKTDDFNNPQIIVPLFHRETASGSMLNPLSVANAKKPTLLPGIGTAFNKVKDKVNNVEGMRAEEIHNLMIQLDNIWNAYRNTSAPANVTIQQPSDADELLKFKSLLDSGVITQEEFDTKKKQLLGL